MTRLPNVSPQKLRKALERAGFVVERMRGSHAIMVHPAKELTTCVPMHGDDVKRGLLKLILKQGGLSEDEFRKLL